MFQMKSRKFANNKWKFGLKNLKNSSLVIYCYACIMIRAF